MRTERNVLVGTTFPALRVAWRAKGVDVFEVELRWGVTEEQIRQGRLLPVILSEVDRCNYFIAILGDRYGREWHESEIGQHLKDSFPALAHAAGLSLTEIEIVHAVLADLAQAKRALFFVRDPAWAASLDDAKRAELGIETGAAQEKVVALKQRIRESGAVVIDYANPLDLDAKAKGAIDALLERDFQEAEAPDAFTLARRLHAAYARERRGLHVGANLYLDVLDRWADQDDAKPMLVTGASGGGKSTLIANWLLAWQRAHPNDIVFEHYLGASPDSADPVLLIRRLWELLNRATGASAEAPVQDRALVDALPRRLAQASSFAARQGVRIFLALDGLDKLTRQQDFRWLPYTLPPRLKLLASSLEGEAQSAAPAGGWEYLTVEPLTGEEQRLFIERTLRAWGRELSPARKDRILEHTLASVPLFLKTVLDELRVSATEDALDSRLRTYLDATTIPDLFARVLERLEADCGVDLVKQAMTLIWASRAGLEESVIIAITGVAPLAWAKLNNGIGGALRDQDGRATFSHEFLRQAVETRFLASIDKRRAVHLDIANYFETHKDSAAEALAKTNMALQALKGAARYHQTSPFDRRMEEVPWQHMKAAAWDRLANFLADLDTMLFAFLRNRSELRFYWTELERHSDLRAAGVYRTALNSTAGREHCYGPVGFLLKEMGRASDALLFLEAARELGPSRGIEYVAASTQFIDILHAQGELGRALAVSADAESALRSRGDLKHLPPILSQRASFMLDQGRLDEALMIEKQIEEVCIAQNDREALSTCLMDQASIWQRRGEHNDAAAALKRAEGIRRELGDAALLAAVLDQQADLRELRGESSVGAELRAQADRAFETHEDIGIRQAHLFNKACTLHEKDQLAEAIKLYDRVEKISRDTGEKKVLARSLSQKAMALAHSENTDAALAAIVEAEAIARSLEDARELMGVLARQAPILHSLGDGGAALAVHKEEEQLARKFNDPDALVASLANQAVVHGALRDPLSAASLLMEAHEMATRRHLTPQVAKVRAIAKLVQQDIGNIAIDLHSRGDKNTAIAMFAAQERLCRTLELWTGLARSLIGRGTAQADAGDGEAATRAAEEAMEVLRREPNPELESHASGLLEASTGLIADKAKESLDRGDVRGALSFLEESSRLFKLCGRAERAITGLILQGMLWTRLGEADKAVAAAEDAHRLSRTGVTPAAQMEVGSLISGLDQGLEKTAQLLVDARSFEGAIQVARLRARLSASVGDDMRTVRLKANEAMLLRTAGRQDEALGTATEAYRLAKSLRAADVKSMLVGAFGSEIKQRARARS